MKGRRTPPKMEITPSVSLPTALTWEALRNAARIYAGEPYQIQHKLTMAGDVLDDYLILYGDTGAQRMEADMLAFFRAAIAHPDKPVPTADDLYIALKTEKVFDQ